MKIPTGFLILWSSLALGVTFVLGGALGTISPMWNNHPHETCVPGYAIDYDGKLGAWLDREGAVVMLAEHEDSYEWCTNR